MKSPCVLAFVLATSDAAALAPLTVRRCKPAVPFDGKHYLVDFALSNLVNSGIRAIYVLLEKNSQSLVDHMGATWNSAQGAFRNFVTVMPPQAGGSSLGTASALGESVRLIRDFEPDIVAVFRADHVYRMDVRQMIAFHQASRAHVTIATLPMPLADSHRFGVLQVDEQKRVTDFQENPEQAEPMPGSNTHVLGSMGNYLFDPDVLLSAVRHNAMGQDLDIGHDLLPRMVETHRLMAYDFTGNTIAGMADFEEPAYWRDLSEIDAYFQAQFDTLGCKPRFRVENTEWPIWAQREAVESAQIENATINRSMVGPGCVLDGALLDHTLLRSKVTVHAGASLEYSIVMDRSVIGAGAQVRQTIVDVDNHVPAGERIGFDDVADRARFHVSPKGVIVVPAGYFPASRAAVQPAGAPGHVETLS